MIIVNVDTIAYIKPREGGYLTIYFRDDAMDGTDEESVDDLAGVQAKDIHVYGEGSMLVNRLLREIAEKAEGGEQDD